MAAQPTTASPAGGRSLGPVRDVLARMEWVGAVAGLVLVGIVLTALSPHFLTAANLTTIVVQTAVVGILATGQTFVILAAEIDLSVAAIAALSGAVTGQLAVHAGWNQYLAVLAGLAIGAGVGLLNGFLSAWVRIPSFIVTLGGLSLWQGFAYQATGGFDTSPMPPFLAFLGRGTIAGIPSPIVILVIVVAVAYLVLRYTKLGRYTYAIGSDADAARLVGIPVRRYKIGVFVVSGALSALAAMVLIGRLNSSGGNIAMHLELDAIAAVILGGTLLFGGRGSVLGSLVGAVLMTTIRNGLALLQVSQYLQQVVLGAVIILAVGIQIIGRREARSR